MKRYYNGLLEDLNLSKESMHTACWRGNYAQFVVCDGMLVLDEVTATFRDLDGKGFPKVNGISPVDESNPDSRIDGYKNFHVFIYKNIGLALPIDGEMLIGKRGEYHPHTVSVFREYYTDKRVLRFEKGKLILNRVATQED